MKMKDINSSSIKTKNLIKKAFAELLAEKKEINNITVTELVKRVDLTRGAFYSHYDNIYQVAAEFQEEILETIFDSNIIVSSKEDINKYFDTIFEYLNNNDKIYSKLLTSNDPLIFMNKLNKKICKILNDYVKGKNSNLRIAFFVDGAINLIIRYFRKEIDSNLIEIREYIKYMANSMLF